MSTPIMALHCSSFQAHVWKPSICANCKGSKEQHTSSVKEKDELATTPPEKSGSKKERTSVKSNNNKKPISGNLKRSSSSSHKHAVSPTKQSASPLKGTSADEKRRKERNKVVHSSSKESISSGVSEKRRVSSKDAAVKEQTVANKDSSISEERRKNNATKTVNRRTPPRSVVEAKGANKVSARTANKPAKQGNNDKPLKSSSAVKAGIERGGGGSSAKHTLKSTTKSADKPTTNIDGKYTNKNTATSSALTCKSNTPKAMGKNSRLTDSRDNRSDQLASKNTKRAGCRPKGGSGDDKQLSRNASIDSIQSSNSSHSASSGTANKKHNSSNGGNSSKNGVAVVTGASSVEAALKTLSSGTVINKGASAAHLTTQKYSATCVQRNEATEKISRSTMNYSAGLNSSSGAAKPVDGGNKSSVTNTQNTGYLNKSGLNKGENTSDNSKCTVSVMNKSGAATSNTSRDNNNSRTSSGQPIATVANEALNNNPIATRRNVSTEPTNGATRGRTAKTTTASSSRANIPLDAKVSRFAATTGAAATTVSSRDSSCVAATINVNSTQHPCVPKTGPASVCSKANARQEEKERSAESAVGGVTAPSKIIEKRKCIVDKGRLSTEKVIVTDATIVTTTRRKNSSDKAKSDKAAGNKVSKFEAAKEKSVKSSTDSKPKRSSIFSSNKNARDTNNAAVSGADKNAPIDSGNISGAKSKPGKVTINESGAATKQPVAQTMDITPKSNVTSISSNEPQPYNRSDSNKSIEDVDGKGTVRRSRSKSSRPAAPPPQVPPLTSNRGQSPTKAMSESFHVSRAIDRDVGASMSPKRNSANLSGGGDGSDFSDLYSDILSTLSSSKDISPDLLNKLKDEKDESKGGGGSKSGSHYYHKYDVTGTTKKSRDMTLSRPLGDATSSIIVETMNTSFHSNAGADDVSDVTTLELTMPYNIVDVSKIPPSKKSPRLPSTPAPEQSSRNSTLERSTLKNRKSAIAEQSRRSESPVGSKKRDGNGGQIDSVSMDGGLELDNSGMGLESVLQGLPPRYWHTYEPIPAANGETGTDAFKSGATEDKSATKSPAKSAKSASVEAMLDTRHDGDFVRASAARATAPGRGFKPDVKSRDTSVSSKPSSPLPHLDLSKPASRSAENLLDRSPEKKVKRSNSKKDKQGGGGFFSRIFGFGRKTSTDDGSSGDTSPEESCSLQENAEFFKPLQITTTESSAGVKEPSLSPPVLDSCDIVSDIERAIAKGQANAKDLSVNPSISDANKSITATASSAAEKQSDISPKNPKPIASPRSSFLYANTAQNASPVLRSPKTVSISPETSVNGSPAKRVSISPEGTMDTRLVTDSLSQSSLLSDGSSDAKSISSREEQGSSGDSQTLKQRKGRPKSQAVSRKMLDAPPPPPPASSLEQRRSITEDARSPRPASTLATSLTTSQASTKSSVSSKTGSSPTTSPSKSPSNPFSSLKVTGKDIGASIPGKNKKGSIPSPGNSTDDTIEKPLSPKKIEISAPIMLQSSTLNESQTLPRPVKKVNVITESRDDTHMATGRRKKIDSVAKHARNKTFTEGVNIDPELLMGSSGSNGDVLSQRPNGGHKYKNRALPPTPTQSPTPTRGIDGPDKKPLRKSVTIQETPPSSRDSYTMNEDIYTDPIEEEEEDIMGSSAGVTAGSIKPPRFTPSSRKALSSCGSSHDKIKSNRPAVFSTLQPPVNLLADYLEPTDTPENRPSFIKPPIATKPASLGNGVNKSTPNSSGAPVLLPRNTATGSSSHATPKENGGTDNYVSMIYVNTEMIIDKTRPPMDVGDGFRCMAFINVETLLHVANTTQTEYIHQDADINQELKFSHFVLKSTKPYVNQGVVAFYNARTYKLKPSDCLLMISAKYINPDLLHHSCVHMLQPSLIFSDRILATYFPESVSKATSDPVKSKPGEPIRSKVYQLGGMVHTNMAVITYHSIHSFEEHMKNVIHKKIKNGEPYERTVCYYMFQILNAVLSAHDGSSLYTIKCVNLNDILLVEHPNAKNEPYLVINPLRSADFDRLDEETLCSDLINVLLQLLNLDPPTDPKSRGSSRKIQTSGDTRFTSGMRRFADVLEKRTFNCLLVARSIMEYLLWGPADREMKSLLLAEDREQSFCIWLEVTRCKFVNELALGQLNRNLELSHMFHFLCALTGSSLLDVKKLLYKGK